MMVQEPREPQQLSLGITLVHFHSLSRPRWQYVKLPAYVMIPLFAIILHGLASTAADKTNSGLLHQHSDKYRTGDISVDAYLAGTRTSSLKEVNAEVAANPHSAQVFARRGNFYLLDGDESKAIADYGVALKLDPKFAVAYLGKAKAYQQASMFPEALQTFKQAAQVGQPPIPFYALTEAAYLCAMTKHDDEAAKLYDEAMKTKAPGHRQQAIALVNKGQFESRIGKYDAAIADLSRAYQLYPASRAIRHRARVFAKVGRYQDAINDYSHEIHEALGELGKDDFRYMKTPLRELYPERAALYEKTGHPELAKQDREQDRKLQEKALKSAPFRLMD